MSTRIVLHPAFILHTRPFRDTSLLLDLLTLGHGRIHAVARGARGLRSRFKGLLQPFVPFLISWSGKTELVSLSQAENNGPPYFLSGSALISGFYLNELLVRLLHRHDAHPNIYKTYQYALACLHRGEPPEPALRVFEVQLLAELGYGLQLHKESVADVAILSDKLYRFDHAHGFITALATDNQAQLFRGKSLLALHRSELQDAEDLQQAKRLLRFVLAPLLGNKPIKSRELFV